MHSQHSAAAGASGMDMPKTAMKAAERAANKGGSSCNGNDSDEEHESHNQVNVDLPFMATISRLGNFIEQGKPLIHRTPSSTNSEGNLDDDRQEICADRRAVDDESTISFTDRARALKIGVVVKRKSKQVADKQNSSSETQSANHHEDNTVNKSELGAGGRGHWDRNRSGEEQDESGKGVGLLSWMRDMPLRIAMHGHGHGSLSLPSSPMLAIKPGSPLNIAVRSGMRSGTPGMRAGGVESMPASPFPALGPMKGGSPLSAASTRVNADSGNFPRAWEVDDSYANSPNVKTSVPKSKNSLVGKIRGMVNPKALNAWSGDGQSFKGPPLHSIPTRATGIVGILM